MQVSVRGMSRDAWNEAVLCEQHLKIVRAFGEPLRRKTDVLGYHHRALGTDFPDKAEQAFAHVPGKFDRFGCGNEFQRSKYGYVLKGFANLPFLARQLLCILGAELNKQCGGVGIELFPIAWRAWKG